MASLRENGFENASPIQEQTIPLSLQGKDIFAQAKTGSGKTGAFAIPVIQQILENPDNQDHYLVLSPTRELAQQTFQAFESIGKKLGIKSVSVIGGESYQKQKNILDQDVHVIVGTPGRVNDLAKQKAINLKAIKCIIFDEADRLFDMGFKKEIEYVLRNVPQNRQLIMVSATTNMDVLQTAYRFNSHPEEINVSEDGLLVEKIDHNIVMLGEEEKFSYLVNLLRQKEDAYAIVFCNTQVKTHEVAEWLKAMGFKASPISGKLAQNKRTRLMQDFRSKAVTILVCTDVAARGLDVKNVNLVVNYDLPNEAANYVHRIGRTGRAGEDGHAVSLCGPDDCENLEGIYHVIDAKIPQVHPEEEDFATDICEKPIIDRRSLRLDSEVKSERNSKVKKLKENNVSNKTKKSQTAGNIMKTKESINSHSETSKTEVNTQKKKVKSMTFNVTSNSLQEAKSQAMNHFELQDENLLVHTQISKGKKKFLFFGPQEVTYEFKVHNPAEDKIKSFLITLIEKMKLDVFVNVSSQGNTIKAEVKGEDIGMFLANRKQLLQAVESIGRQYIIKNNEIPSTTRLYVNGIGTNPKPLSAKTSERNANSPQSNNAASKRGPRKSANGNRDNRDNRENRDRRRQNSDEWLKKLALKLKDEALASGKEQATKPLNPAERRIIHQTLEDAMGVATSSIGEGRLKRVLISLDR